MSQERLYCKIIKSKNEINKKENQIKEFKIIKFFLILTVILRITNQFSLHTP